MLNLKVCTRILHYSAEVYASIEAGVEDNLIDKDSMVLSCETLVVKHPALTAQWRELEAE